MAVNKLKQNKRTDSPWTFKHKFKMLIWDYIWVLFCRWTPKPFNKWRIFWLKIFGAQINGHVFVHQRSYIQIPWHIILHDGACIGDKVVLYSLDIIEIGANSTIAQESYLCTGSHDFTKDALPLETKKIQIKQNVFVGARAFIMPGVIIEDGAIVGACSVVYKNVERNAIVAGNPSKTIKYRRYCSVDE